MLDFSPKWQERKILFGHGTEQKDCREITKRDLFADGLSGGECSSVLRAELCRYFELPEDLTAKAMLEALNMLVGYSEYKSAVLSLKERK